MGLKEILNSRKVPLSEVGRLGINSNNIYIDKSVIKKLNLVEKATASLESYSRKPGKGKIVGPANMPHEQWVADLWW